MKDGQRFLSLKMAKEQKHSTMSSKRLIPVENKKKTEYTIYNSIFSADDC